MSPIWSRYAWITPDRQDESQVRVASRSCCAIMLCGASSRPQRHRIQTVDIARFFLKFTQAESCGKCTFCRNGTKRMLEILERLWRERANATIWRN